MGGGKNRVHFRYFSALVSKISRKGLILKGFKVRRLSIFTYAIFDKVDGKYGYFYLGKKYYSK